MHEALDLWMAGCMISVFASLGEFVIVKVIQGKYNILKEKEAKPFKETTIINEWTYSPSPKYIPKFRYENMRRETFIPLHWRTETGKEKIMWKEVDRISRIVFPSFFFIFCVMYWMILIFGSGV